MDFLQLTTEKLAKILHTQGIVTPTPVQASAMPIIAQKRDVMAQSATGTGKTLAYLLPIFAGLNPDVKGPQAVILAPTYELASQISKVAQGLADTPGDVALIIGGANKARQTEALKAKPKLVIGSLGRILEHMADKKLSVHHVRTLVFDEADRLFYAENMEGIGKLVKATLRERQILLFSASISDAAAALAAPLMKDPAILRLDTTMPQNIQHFYISASPREKFENLRKLVHALDTRAIVFVNVPFTIEKVAARLNHHKLAAMPLYGAAEKAKRKGAIDAFKAGRTRLLVASDVGSRGLDVPNLDCIINLDLPETENDYLHRAGRCGRMGGAGVVVSIVAPKEIEILEKFAQRLGISVVPKTIARGKFVNP